MEYNVCDVQHGSEYRTTAVIWTWNRVWYSYDPKTKKQKHLNYNRVSLRLNKRSVHCEFNWITVNFDGTLHGFYFILSQLQNNYNSYSWE